ncbi:hypothetical protein PSHT_09954 [Puccinia striiformis]|uniref:Uncharacterized protein n=1 Tax=Puccinia striiformis TaxID=27350 RepID=A0A2S4VD31_9BASI|nr:hypothetical protein PSHT_09954 [Puccinia striiformis]
MTSLLARSGHSRKVSILPHSVFFMIYAGNAAHDIGATKLQVSTRYCTLTQGPTGAFDCPEKDVQFFFPFASQAARPGNREIAKAIKAVLTPRLRCPERDSHRQVTRQRRPTSCIAQ